VRICGMGEVCEAEEVVVWDEESGGRMGGGLCGEDEGVGFARWAWGSYGVR